MRHLPLSHLLLSAVLASCQVLFLPPAVLSVFGAGIHCAAENSVYYKLEKLIHAATGVEPRCWNETDYSWQEQERPSASA